MTTGTAEGLERQECLICGATDLLDLTVCPDCGGTDSRVADRLLFVSGVRGIRRRDVQARLADLTGLTRGAEPVESVSRGLRAIARVPAGSVPRAIERLAAQGIPAAARLPRRVWAALPFGFLALLSLAVAAGMWAGTTVTPLLLVTTPLVVGLLLRSAVRGIRRPIHPFDPPAPAPAALLPVLPVLLELPNGRARDLLAGLARSVRVLSGEGLSAGVLASLDALLPVAAQAAADLAMLDDTLDRLDATPNAAGQPTIRKAIPELQAAQARLEEYLLEATGLVGRLQGASADALTSAGARLHELADDFRTAAAAQCDALQAV